MRDAEVLRTHRRLMHEAMALKEQADAVTMIGMPGGASGQALTGMPRGTNDPMAASLQKAQAYLDRLERTRIKLLNLCDRFEVIVERIEDGDDRSICRMYYGAGLTDEEIADKLSLDRSTITKRRDAVIKSIEFSQNSH